MKEELKQQYENNRNNLENNWREKFTKVETQAQTFKTGLRESEQREQEMTSKYNKMKVKMDKLEI